MGQRDGGEIRIQVSSWMWAIVRHAYRYSICKLTSKHTKKRTYCSIDMELILKKQSVLRFFLTTIR